MKITLVGMGSGAPGSLTAEGLETLRGAELIIGARRLLENLPRAARQTAQPSIKRRKFAHCCGRQIARRPPWFTAATPGFYSGAAALCCALDAFGSPCRCCRGFPAFSCWPLRWAAPWQEWRLVSAHGCACDPVAACRAGGKLFFPDRRGETPASLCRRLAAAGLGDAHVLVGEKLGRPEEKILFGTAQELAAKAVCKPERSACGTCSRRPAAGARLARMKPFTGEGAHDQAGGAGGGAGQAGRAARRYPLGCGRGHRQRSVELALAAPRGHVYAVECDAEACDLIRQKPPKLAVQIGRLPRVFAPAALAGWPAPDAVFIGGSKGSLRAVVDVALAANPDARLCISAIALETLSSRPLRP